MPEVTFQPIGKRVLVPSGSSLLDAARQAGIELSAVCGGEGSCGQCRVQVLSGSVSTPSASETFILTGQELANGERLACCTQICGDVKVHIPTSSLLSGTRLQIESSLRDVTVDPLIRAVDVEAPAPCIEDPRADVNRLLDAMARPDNHMTLFAEPAVVRQISPSAREYGWKMSVYVRDAEIVGIGPRGRSPVGLAVDLGTTKIAAFLLDLETGQELAAAGAPNPQIGYGEDVISRLNYARHRDDGAQILAGLIGETLTDLLDGLTRQADVDRYRIVDACIVGNTAMTHLMLQLPTAQLATAPYVAATSAALDVKARDIGLEIAPGAYVHILPGIGGFVGADHVAMILAGDMDRTERVTIGVDIGTNTEIALAQPGAGFLISTSCASGPAFEGAHVTDGMRAASGAIEAVHLLDPGVRLKTIGQGAPVGLCGSGIVDAIAEMRRRQVINYRGRFQKDNPRVRIGHDGPELLLAPANESGSGRDVVITQQDINAIQLAKGAIRAGLDVMLQTSQVLPEEIEEVLIAGAFGSFLNIESALDIGLLPRFPHAVYRQVGNAAAVGAKWALISRAERERARQIASTTRYLELMTHPDFSHLFALGMFFPTDEEIDRGKT